MEINQNECDLCSQAYRRQHHCPRDRGMGSLSIIACEITHQIAREGGGDTDGEAHT